MARTIQNKRGLEKNLPTLKPGELAVTNDTKKVFVGTDSGNIEVTNKDAVNKTQLIPLASKDYVTEQIVRVNTGGTVDISTKADKTYVEQLNGINNYTTIPTFENDILNKLEELDGNTVVKRTTLTYNTDGSISTVRDETKGKTVISTFNYTNGIFSSISKQLIEGGL